MHVALLYFTCSILYSFPSQLYSLVEGGTLIGKCLATQHKVIASWTVVSWPGIWHVHPWATPSPPMSTKGWLKIYQLHDFLHFSLTKSCSSILMKLHQASSFLSLFRLMRWDFFKEFLPTWKHFEFGNQTASLSSTCNLTWSARFISSAQKCWILNRDVSNLSQFFYIDKQEISPQNKEKTLSKKGLLFIVNLDSTL